MQSPTNNISHTVRLDAKTLSQAEGYPGIGTVASLAPLPQTLRLMSFSPLIFTHAYQLLGNAPQRFGEDLSLYLATVVSFFDRSKASGGIDLTGGAWNPDSLRKLSEDLGVACAALFMSQVFGIKWDTVAQIPQNLQLSKKRPDFEGFTAGEKRFLFEAKGTTRLSKVEKQMSNARDQVKGYPEAAESKLAIVTYLCADNRFFPSTSFVIDPPALPTNVPPDRTTARLLHFEKTLEFAGLFRSARSYVRALAKSLSEAQSAATEFAAPPSPSDKLNTLLATLRTTLADERQTVHASEPLQVNGQDYVGRMVPLGGPARERVKIFTGVAKTLFDSILNIDPNFPAYDESETMEGPVLTSTFCDGTVLQVTLSDRKSPEGK